MQDEEKGKRHVWDVDRIYGKLLELIILIRMIIHQTTPFEIQKNKYNRVFCRPFFIRFQLKSNQKRFKMEEGE